MCDQRRLRSDWADAQADLSLCWAHSHVAGFVMGGSNSERNKKEGNERRSFGSKEITKDMNTPDSVLLSLFMSSARNYKTEEEMERQH